VFLLAGRFTHCPNVSLTNRSSPDDGPIYRSCSWWYHIAIPWLLCNLLVFVQSRRPNPLSHPAPIASLFITISNQPMPFSIEVPRPSRKSRFLALSHQSNFCLRRTSLSLSSLTPLYIPSGAWLLLAQQHCFKAHSISINYKSG
jgi:hypothetical protein